MLYAITTRQDDSLVKIGTSEGRPSVARMRERLSALATSNPLDLVCVALSSGDHRDERRLHREFSHYRFRGEWFLNHREVASWVTENRLAEPIDAVEPTRSRVPFDRAVLARELGVIGREMRAGRVRCTACGAMHGRDKECEWVWRGRRRRG